MLSPRSSRSDSDVRRNAPHGAFASYHSWVSNRRDSGETSPTHLWPEQIRLQTFLARFSRHVDREFSAEFPAPAISPLRKYPARDDCYWFLARLSARFASAANKRTASFQHSSADADGWSSDCGSAWIACGVDWQ